jgi:tetratricopeptide (TPR) repeat protein
MKTQSFKEYLKKWILLAILIFSPVLSMSQEDPEIIKIVPSRIEETDIIQLNMDTKSFDFDLFESRIQALWFKRKVFLSTNRMEEADKHMDMLKSFCKQEGIRRLPTIARALTFEGIQYFQEGNFEKAKMSFHHAIAFDPFLVQPRIALAKTYWKSEGNIWNFLIEIIKAGSYFVQNFWTVITISSNFVILLLISIGGLFLFFSTLIALKYNTRFRHKIAESFRRRKSKKGSRLMGWFLFLLPLFTIVGAGFLFFYWTILFFRYMNRREKLISYAFFVVFVFATLCLMMVRSIYHVAVDEEVKISLESASCSYDPEKIIQLQEQIKNRPDDPTYHFLIASIYKRGGYYQESFNHYLKVLDLNPSSCEALNNIGNIFFKFGQFSQAITYYKRIISINPKFILAYLNLSIAQTENFHFKDAEETMRKARAINSEETARWISAKRDLEHVEAIDASIDTTNIWKKALIGKTGLRKKGSAREDSASSGGYINILSVVSLLSLFFLFIFSFQNNSGVFQCMKCGRIYCPKCGYYKEYPDYCTHCVHLFIKKDGLEPKAETIKLKEINRHRKVQKIATRFLALLFPGSKQIFENKTFTGVFILFLWLFSICGLWVKGRLLSISEPGMISFSAIVYPIFFFLLILSWMMGNVRFSFRKRRHPRYGA